MHAYGLRPAAPRRARGGAEWVLLDYGGFIVHIFSERLRHFYDIERLWRMAERIDFSEPSSDSDSDDDASAAGGSLA